MIVRAASRSAVSIRGRKLRVLGVDRLRQLVYVYGWRDVVARPVAVLELRRLGL